MRRGRLRSFCALLTVVACCACDLVWQSSSGPVCTLRELAAGSWAPGCGNTSVQDVLPVATALSASHFAISTGGHSKESTLALCTLQRSAELLRWGWQPDTGCSLRAWDANANAARLSGKKLVFVGDSLTEQAVASFLLLAEQQGHSVSECEPTVRDLFSLAHAVCSRVDTFFVVLVFTKVNLVNNSLMPITPEEAQACRESAHGNTSLYYEASENKKRWFARGEKDSGPPLCYAHSWLAAARQADILVLNYGLWYLHYDYHFEQYDTVTTRILHQLRTDFRGEAVIFRTSTTGSTPPSNLDCSDSESFTAFNAPLTTPAAKGDRYQWAAMVDRERAFWLPTGTRTDFPWRLRVLNVEPAMSLRVDGRVDCVHYCPVGPMLWVARFLHHAIIGVS